MTIILTSYILFVSDVRSFFTYMLPVRLSIPKYSNAGNDSNNLNLMSLFGNSLSLSTAVTLAMTTPNLIVSGILSLTVEDTNSGANMLSITDYWKGLCKISCSKLIWQNQIQIKKKFLTKEIIYFLFLHNSSILLLLSVKTFAKFSL